jgi:putative Ca2+/H+ antiporter (TMEM165/GDT1 family)
MLTGFTAGLLLITISELGDKTFFIGAILAMRHPRRWVFIGVTLALFLMTVLSVLLGKTVSILPQYYVEIATIVLFLGFGFKLIYDASRISPDVGLDDEEKEAEAEVNQKDHLAANASVLSILVKAFTLTFVAEWGDRTQFATITLAANQDTIGVILGATLGHAICAVIAVMCGKLIAGRISERWLTFFGGALFVLFGVVAAFQAFPLSR